MIKEICVPNENLRVDTQVGVRRRRRAGGRRREDEGVGGEEIRKNGQSPSQSCFQNDFMYPMWN